MENDITTIVIQPLHARAACQQAIIMHGEGYCAKNKECMGVYLILACNLLLETDYFLTKILTKKSTKYFEKYDYLEAVFLEQINK